MQDLRRFPARGRGVTGCSKPPLQQRTAGRTLEEAWRRAGQASELYERASLKQRALEGYGPAGVPSEPSLCNS